jgi:hypothetical protein
MKKPSKQMTIAMDKAAAINFIIRTGGIFIQELRPLNFFYRMEVKK